MKDENRLLNVSGSIKRSRTYYVGWCRDNLLLWVQKCKIIILLAPQLDKCGRPARNQSNWGNRVSPFAHVFVFVQDVKAAESVRNSTES